MDRPLVAEGGGHGEQALFGHVDRCQARAVNATTGGVLDGITVEATAQGYAELVEFANNHATLRAWAIEGTGGHGC